MYLVLTSWDEDVHQDKYDCNKLNHQNKCWFWVTKKHTCIKN
jgi:hypothetical protein